LNSTPPTCRFVIVSSSASTTGRIDQMNAGVVINGTLVVQRFLTGGAANYWDICAPVNGVDLTMWDDDLIISGVGFPDGSACDADGCFYSVKYYQVNTFIDVTDINASLPCGRGYEVWCGDDLTTFSGTTLEVEGTVNGPSDFVDAVGSQWQTKGNPFAAPILYSGVTKAGVGNWFYVFDPVADTYQWYDGASSTSSIAELASGRLTMGQAFWTKGPGTLTYPQACITTSGDFLRGRWDLQQSLQLKLSSQSTTYSCVMALDEVAGLSDSYDDMIDVPHFSTGNEKSSSIYMVTGGEKVRNNHIGRDFRDKSFDVSVDIKYSDIYYITPENIANFNNYRHVYLVDKTTGESVDLKNVEKYAFVSEPGEFDRFKLVLTNGENITKGNYDDLGTEVNNISIQQMGNSIDIQVTGLETATAPVTVTLFNVIGQQSAFTISTSVSNGSNIVTLPEGLSGLHILTVQDATGTVSKKIVL